MKTIQLFTPVLLAGFIAVSCNNPSGNTVVQQSQPEAKVIQTAGVETSMALKMNNNSSSAGLSAAENILAANKAGKAVFLVVTGKNAPGTDKALLIANGAKMIYKNSVVIQMDRDDVSNASLVKEYRLSGAPLPVILVISSKGFPTGGYLLAQATAENLAALVPSPKLEVVYETISKGKYAIVTFSKKSFTDKPEVLKECKKAVTLLKNEAVLIEVDMDDPGEVNFLNQLRIDKSQFNSSLTLVINKQGQISGTATTIPDATKLAAAATTPVQGGCGPGCGPAGCGK